MKRIVSIFVLGIAVAFGLSSCMKDAEPKPTGPVSDTGTVPWNVPLAGQGQGQLGQLPQSQYRR